MANISELKFHVNSPLEKELEFFATSDDGRKAYAGIASPEDIRRTTDSNADLADLQVVVENLPPGPLLDVGVGWGITSGYLASHGFTVTAVEPSLDACRLMASFFQRLGLAIKVVRGTGESLDQVAGSFEAVVFWSSLHHCDDPERAVRNAFERLRPGGKIVLYEPVLRFYRTKAWFYRMMEEHPEKVGHYGGNEHIYRYQEYLTFLKRAGFVRPVARLSLKYFLGPKRAGWDNGSRWRLKQVFYATLRLVGRSRNPLRWLLMNLSLLTPVIIAEKPRPA